MDGIGETTWVEGDVAVITSNNICRGDLLLALLSILGIAISVWPEKIQEIRVRSQEPHPKLAALSPFSDWMRTPSFLIVVRAAGLALICFSLVGFYFGWKNCLGRP
jgi:hypothetical protein